MYYKCAAEELIKLREGLVLDKYKDSLGKWTGGYGHLLSPEEMNIKITKALADKWFEGDVKWAKEAAEEQLKAITGTPGGPRYVIPDVLQSVLVSVNFQLGAGWIKKFPKTFSKIKAGDFDGAATEVEDSLWAKQTPVRVRDFQRALWITAGLNHQG